MYSMCINFGVGKKFAGCVTQLRLPLPPRKKGANPVLTYNLLYPQSISIHSSISLKWFYKLRCHLPSSSAVSDCPDQCAREFQCSLHSMNQWHNVACLVFTPPPAENVPPCWRAALLVQ